jgi:hypothetical protein
MKEAVMKNVGMRSLAFVLIVLLSSCGGGGGGGTVTSTPSAANLTGVFSDAPVAGLTYTTSSGASGTTNALGQFNFAAGDTVTFKAAGITLGSAIPTVSATGNATVTPLNLVQNALGVSDQQVTAIGQLLGTLNNIAKILNQSSSGVFNVPTGAAVVNFFAQLQALGVSPAQLINSGAVQTAIATTLSSLATVPVVTTSTDAQSNMTQGINGAGFIGTVWSGTCTCGGGGTFYFQADGTLAGFTDSGDLLSGTWSPSTTASGGIQFSLVSSSGGYSNLVTLTPSATSASATIYTSSAVVQGILTISPLSANAAITSSLYMGGWYGVYTPNAAGLAAGNTSGSAYFILAANGSLYGITDSGNYIAGTWNAQAGTATGSFTNAGSRLTTIALSLPNASGTVTVAGTSLGSVALSRTGALKINKYGGAGAGNGTTASSNPPIPLLLNVSVSWPNNVGNVVSSFALGLTVKDAQGNPIASIVKQERNPFGPNTNQNGTPSNANTTTDNISASYPTGLGASYQLSVGPSNCTIGGGTASVVDSNSGTASAYPTVSITCH